jgi:hypothetical protein
MRKTTTNCSHNTLIPDWDSKQSSLGQKSRAFYIRLFDLLLIICFHVGILLGLFFDPEDGGDMFFQNVFRRTTWSSIPSTEIHSSVIFRTNLNSRWLRDFYFRYRQTINTNNCTYFCIVTIHSSFFTHEFWNLPLDKYTTEKYLNDLKYN